MAFLAAIGREVRRQRAKRGMTRRQLAQASQTSERYLAQIESGAGNPSVSVLRAIAQALDLPAAALLPDTGGRGAALGGIIDLVAQVPQGEWPALAKMIEARVALPSGADRGRRIALVGLRGAGKSTLGRMLAQHLGWPFIEIDRRVEEDYGASIPDLMEMAGTATFRRHERGALEHVIAEHEAAVITTAGGIVSNPETYALLLRRAHTVWIKARPEEHMSRVMAQGDFRPMAQNRAAMADLVAILEARRADYARAEVEVDTSGNSAEQSFAALLRVVTPWTQAASGEGRASGAADEEISGAAAMTLADDGFLDLGSARLEYRMIGPRPDAAPTIVMLHEGLGCVGLWGTFPDKLAAATGAGVFVYSRAGYGRSSPAKLPRPLSFMDEEALDVLPRLLAAIGFQRGILLGHSDGASIATIYAGGVQDHRVRGLVLMAPHFFTEEMGLAEIRRAGEAFDAGVLRDKLKRWHADVDGAFRSWIGPWLDPDFRKWDITEALGYIRVPILIVQGADDQYGTLRQVEVAKEECFCPVETAVLAAARHSPHRDAPEATLEAVAGFINRLLCDHREGEPRMDSGVAA